MRISVYGVKLSTDKVLQVRATSERAARDKVEAKIAESGKSIKIESVWKIR
ncbi:hypothetical protein ACQEU8_02325 [Streptomyces sp. CA-250714]|uniref:hypothetical protein n=1 Tax=Streptomyces sp. CA-250714 TaxID=3240060 RepID=UPI003D8DB16D